MTSMEIELIRPSKLGEWATCAKKMRYLAANSPVGRGPHISSWIGNRRAPTPRQ